MRGEGFFSVSRFNSSDDRLLSPEICVYNRQTGQGILVIRIDLEDFLVRFFRFNRVLRDLLQASEHQPRIDDLSARISTILVYCSIAFRSMLSLTLPCCESPIMRV